MHYEQLGEEVGRVIDLIGKSLSPPTSPAGYAAMARVALSWTTIDVKGNFLCEDWREELLVRLSEGLAAGFVWPPRPGSCSTALWAPPPSPEEIADRDAEQAGWASLDAEIQANQRAEEAEIHRQLTPSLMPDDKLRKHYEAVLDIRKGVDRLAAQASDELVRRGLLG